MYDLFCCHSVLEKILGMCFFVQWVGFFNDKLFFFSSGFSIGHLRCHTKYEGKFFLERIYISSEWYIGAS